MDVSLLAYSGTLRREMTFYCYSTKYKFLNNLYSHFINHYPIGCMHAGIKYIDLDLEELLQEQIDSSIYRYLHR